MLHCRKRLSNTREGNTKRQRKCALQEGALTGEGDEAREGENKRFKREGEMEGGGRAGG